MYALWLVPAGRQAEQLSILIDRLAHQYQGPTFAPHVTLLGKVEGEETDLADGTHRLAALLGNMQARVQGFGAESLYYKSLYLDIASSPELDQANRLAREHFRLQGDYEFRPHLSLLYGEQTEDMKQSARDEVDIDAGVIIELSTLQLIAAFDAVENWRVVTSDALRKAPA